MREKLQIINGVWWFLYGDNWKILSGFKPDISRQEVREKARVELEEFRQECEKSKRMTYVGK